MPKYPPRDCENPHCPHGENGKPKRYTPKRRWQKYCCDRCRKATNGSGVIYIPIARRRKRHSAASKTQVSACRPWHLNLALVDAGGGFQTIYGKPRNFGGEMTRLAMANPQFIVRLADAEARDAARQFNKRVSCRTCLLHCEDGAACARLAHPQMTQIAQVKEGAAA